MDNRTPTARGNGLRSLLRVIRAFAEGSLVVLGFALSMVLVGTPLALLARGVHAGLSWLVRLTGEPSTLIEAFVSLATAVGSVILVGGLIRLLVGFVRWRSNVRVA